MLLYISDDRSPPIGMTRELYGRDCVGWFGWYMCARVCVYICILIFICKRVKRELDTYNVCKNSINTWRNKSLRCQLIYVCMFECVHILVSYTNLIMCDTSITWLVIGKSISQRNWHCVYYLDSWCVCNVCTCPVIFMHMKEGIGGSRWEREDGVIILYIHIMKEGVSGS